MNLLCIYKDQFGFNIFLKNTEFVIDGITVKYRIQTVIFGNGRKRPKPFPIFSTNFVFVFSLTVSIFI